MHDNPIAVTTVMIAVLLAGLGLFVSMSMVKRPVKLSFSLICASLLVWVLANTGADLFIDESLMITRIAFAAMAIVLASLAGFVLWFPRRIKHALKGTIIALALGAAMAYLSMTPHIVSAVVFVDSYSNVVSGDWYWVYTSYVVIAVLFAMAILIKRLRLETSMDKERVKYMLAGVAITASIAIVTNLILPLITGGNPLAIYGSLATVGLISMVAYSILKHQLFSIRVATARAVAYLLSGISLGLLFGIIILWFDNILFAGTVTSVSQKLFYAMSAVLIGFTFPSIKGFFDKITRRIFLRDIYDPEKVLTDIADIVAAAKKSTPLLRRVCRELQEQLHLEFVEAYLKDDDTWERKAFFGKQTKDQYILSGNKAFSQKDKVVIRLDDEDDIRAGRDDLGLVAILRTAEGPVGYLAIGYKRNGTIFTSSDINLIEAIANEIAIATENFLRYEAIEAFSETLQHKVDDATKELRLSNRRLKELDGAKDEFISMASHQLRTPLTSVKGYLSMVLEGDVGKLNSMQRKMLNEAFTSSQRMVYLIGDFLNVSRLQTGKFVLELKPTNLAAVVSEEVEQQMTAAKARQMDIHYDKPSSLPILKLDENKLRQVIMNFIDNAIYYSKPDTTINVELSKTDKYVTFKVKDNGIGVPTNQQHHLFEKFFRASNAKHVRPDGTGIGLFMAKKVIIAHGGSVIFESKENQGSTFGFRLPITS